MRISDKFENSRWKRPKLYITILIYYLVIAMSIATITLILKINYYNIYRDTVFTSTSFELFLIMFGWILAAAPSIHAIISLISKKKSGLFTTVIALIPLGIMISLSYDFNYYSLGYAPPLPDKIINLIIQWIGFGVSIGMVPIVILSYLCKFWNTSKS